LTNANNQSINQSINLSTIFLWDFGTVP